MGHYLQFGAGPNQLPPPWQNLSAAHDIRKPLRFGNESVSFILAEHVIEHVPFVQGFNFLQECCRVLEPSGVLRLAFPDIGRFTATPTRTDEAQQKGFNGRALRYAQTLEQRDGGQIIRNVRTPREKVRAAMLLLLVGWQHMAAWSEETAAGSLLVVGFHDVTRRRYGESDRVELKGVDGHHKDVGDELAEMETTVLEATK